MADSTTTMIDTTRPRVLAVDDERVMRTIIDRVLTQAGIEVVAVEVEEAVALLDTDDFDLVICDRSMPGISGQEFLDRVRSNPRFDFTPFLFLTVSEEIDDLIAGLGAGADDYMTKPFHPSELIARVTGHLDRAEQRRRREHELVDVETFSFVVDRELTRAGRGSPGGVLAIVDIPSLKAVESSLGDRERRRVLETIAAVMGQSAEPLDILGATKHGDLAILMPESTIRDAANRLRAMATQAASMVTQAQGLNIRPVPMIGFVEFERNRVETSEAVFERAAEAAAEADRTQDLQPRRWISPEDRNTSEDDHRPSREMLQLSSTFSLGLLVPFLVYMTLDLYGIDVSWPVYIAVVIALVSTGALIWLEGFYAARHPGAPPVAGAPEPHASAIICAYMPNEAATIVETIENFLEVDYPAGLQIILAYNTPEYTPVEAELELLARSHPNLLLLKVENSNSKAQNLNAALARATGEFIGVFDADHHPDHDSFHRAWRWLSNGYDVVQGHCLVRNADESFLARMVAVEFETIYSVAHPGRWLRDGFGIFGGSNGYWRTEVLHMTRMRGSMLTEDIDASMRVLEAGGQIASDPGLISRELATTTARQIWNQRLRWAQGWTQVSMRHLWQMMRLPHFNMRQKFGVFMLLFQREIYPWISFQIFPLLAFWWLRGDLLDWFVPLFVAATIFTTTVGPGMTMMAYKLSHPTIKHRWWFVQYGIFSTLIYTEAKNIIARVAHLKEVMGESSWRVTPRSADPAGAALPADIVAGVFESPDSSEGEADDSASPLVAAGSKKMGPHRAEMEMLARTRRSTGSCLWCGETRALSVDRCARCGNGWIDQTLDEAATAPVIELQPGGPDTSVRSRRWRRWLGYGAAAAIITVVAVGAIKQTASPEVPAETTLPAPVAAPAAVASAPPSTTVTPTTAAPTTVAPVTTSAPATTAPPATTTTTTTSTTTTTTTTLPPLPATNPVDPDSLTLGAFALGPFSLGSDGPTVAGALVATLGQPDARLDAEVDWGLCRGDSGRVLEWGGLGAVFRYDGDRELFVGYRYRGDETGRTSISGLRVGMTLTEAQAVYPTSIVTTGTADDGSPIFLLVRSSDRRTLLWGPLDDAAETSIAGINSYRPCDRGPFAG